MKSPQVFGKYVLLERISVGGMAEIFIAKAFGVEGFERILAIKKILPTMAEDAEFITMFIDEARISSQLNHANVVHIHELGKYDENYYIAMEYVQGLDLRAIAELYRRERQAMPVPMAAYIVAKVCEGLDYAHRKKDGRGQDLNIVHRDVSPQNVLVSFDGEVKIIDFGIAKAANRSQHTQVGILKGKFGYMSPEQAMGKPIDRRSDLFAVGVILYELLTGDRLFVGESDFSVVEKVRTADIVSPREMNPEIPKALEKVILKALAKDQHDRYQWCSELQEDLNRFLLTDGALYSGKQLSAFMKEAFAEDLQREGERLEKFSKLERPDDLEDSSVEVSPRRRTSSSKQMPAVTGSRPAPVMTPSRGMPAAGPAPRRTDSGTNRAAAAREPVRAQSESPARRMTPPPRRAPVAPQAMPDIDDLDGLDSAPPPDRTQIVDASHLQDKPPEDTGVRAVAEQATNVKERPPPKGRVVIGEKAVHGPTVIGAVPEAPPERSSRRNGAPAIDAPPSVVVDAGLGMDEASAPDTGVHSLPEDTGSYPVPPELSDDEPRTQGVDSYSFGDEAPEHTPVARPPEEDAAPAEDDAPPPWPSMEGKGETFVGQMPVDPDEADALARGTSDDTGRHPRPTEDDSSTSLSPPSVIVGGERLGDSDEHTPADPPSAETTASLDSVSVDPSYGAPSLAERAPSPTATAEISGLMLDQRMSPAAAAAPALGDGDAPPSTGSMTVLDLKSPSSPAPAPASDPAMSAGDELDALMGSGELGGREDTGRVPAPAGLSDEEQTGATGDHTGRVPAPDGLMDEATSSESAPALGDGPLERTGEVPELAADDTASAPSDSDGVPEGYTGMDRTAAIPAPSELRDDVDPDENEDEDADRTAAIEPPAGLVEGYQGQDRTGSSPAPEGMADEDATGAYQGQDRTGNVPRPESDSGDEPEEGYQGHDRTAAVPAPSELADDREEDDARGDEPSDEEEELAARADEDQAELTRPERPKRTPVAANPNRQKMIILGSAGGAVALLALVLALTLGGGGSSGALLVRVEPANAQLLLDGKPIRNGEVITDLPAGQHVLSASAPGFKPQTQPLKTTDAQTTAQLTLEPERPAPQAPPEEAPAPSPATAAAAPTETTPPPAAPVEAAREPAEAQAKAPEPQEPAEKPEPVAEREPEPAAEKPAPRPQETRVASAATAKPAPKKRANGQLACTSSPQGAEIFIDGKSTNRKTPVPFGSAISVPAGSHTLLLKSGRLKYSTKIQISEGEMTIVRNAVLE